MTSPALDHPVRLGATAVLLDLDGTVTDSAAAITGAIAETLEAFGRPPLAQDTLLRFVGPPIREGFRDIAAVPEAEIEPLVADYRTRYAARMADVPVFPGVDELIRSWHAAGVPLALATAKLQTMAEPILDAAGLTAYFTTVSGVLAGEDTLGGVQAKANVISRALDGLSAAGADITGAVMVGDRYHDIAGAGTHGLTSVLVRWGYGRPGEEEGAAAVVHDAGELAAVLAARPSTS